MQFTGRTGSVTSGTSDSQLFPYLRSWEVNPSESLFQTPRAACNTQQPIVPSPCASASATTVAAVQQAYSVLNDPAEQYAVCHAVVDPSFITSTCTYDGCVAISPALGCAISSSSTSACAWRWVGTASRLWLIVKVQSAATVAVVQRACSVLNDPTEQYAVYHAVVDHSLPALVLTMALPPSSQPRGCAISSNS